MNSISLVNLEICFYAFYEKSTSSYFVNTVLLWTVDNQHTCLKQRSSFCTQRHVFRNSFLRYNHPEIMQYLIENGADIEAMNARNNRPLHYAAKMGNVDVATVLIGKHVCMCKRAFLRVCVYAREGPYVMSRCCFTCHPNWIPIAF